MASDDRRGSIAAIFIGGGLVYNGVKRILKTRRVQDTATSRIAYAPQGNVEIEAYAWPIQGGYTSNSGQRCSYYRCKLQKLVKSGKSKTWRTEWTYVPTTAFLAIDYTGAVEIHTTGAELTMR